MSKERYTGVAGKVGPLARIPFVRGIIQFIDSLVLGMRTLMFSASFYEEEEGEGKALTREEKEKQEKKEAWMMRAVAAVSVVLAVGIFMILPYFLSGFWSPWSPPTTCAP